MQSWRSALGARDRRAGLLPGHTLVAKDLPGSNELNLVGDLQALAGCPIPPDDSKIEVGNPAAQVASARQTDAG